MAESKPQQDRALFQIDLDDTQDKLTEVHPALDVVGKVLYVTVWVPIKGKGLTQVVLSSAGDVFTQEAWQTECELRGLVPMTAEVQVPKARCSPRVVAELQAGELREPAFREVYDRIYTAMAARLEVRDERYLTVLALFAMMTYFHPLFETLPILHLRGPAGSGKSRGGGCVAQVAFNGVAKGNPSPATIFRNVDRARYTYVVTEGDNLADLDSGDRYAQQLQSSTTKAEANVDVAEGDRKFEPRTYFTFAPKVYITTKPIKSQPLRTRCIRLDITRTPNANQTKLRTPIVDESVWQTIRDDLYRLQLGAWKVVADKRDLAKRRWNTVTGRTFDNWLPLMTIALCVGNDVAETIKSLAADDMEAHQADAASTFEAVLYKFAVHTFARHETMRRDDLWWEFMDEKEYGHAESASQPQWAKETDTAVTRGQLRAWVKGKRKLVEDLQRLGLLDKAVEGREFNYYRTDAANARRLAEQYLGNECGDTVEVGGDSVDFTTPPQPGY